MYAVSISIFSICDDDQDPTFIFDSFEKAMSFAKVIIDNGKVAIITKKGDSDIENPKIQ